MAKERRRTKSIADITPVVVAAQGEVQGSRGRRQEVRVELPTGEADLEALRSITRDWLVPRLVEKFLRVHGAEPSATTHGNSESSTASNYRRANAKTRKDQGCARDCERRRDSSENHQYEVLM